MTVKLISHTPDVEQVLTHAFSQCYQLEAQGKKPNIEVVKRNIKHQSVLEHAVYTFDIAISRVAWEQLVRQRIGTAFDSDGVVLCDSITYQGSYTAQSHRYTEPSYEDCIEVVPDLSNLEDPTLIVDWLCDMETIYFIYKKWREKGLKKEDARYILPCGILIRATVTFNLRSLIHLWLLRLDPHAQWEIQQFAKGTLDEVLPTIPNLAETVKELANIKE